MNNLFGRVLSSFALAAAMLLFAMNGRAQDKKTATGEEFFIVASIDQAKSQVLLKHPTEVTTLLNVNGKTRILDDDSKQLHLANLRTGDTVWVVSLGSGASATAIQIRKGPMSEAELHRYYLDYPEIK